MASAAKVKARQDLVRFKNQLRQQAREREQRIEASALTVLVQLARRADAEVAAGRAIEDLHAEGLKASEIAAWCGGLTVSELNRLRAAARNAGVDPASDAVGVRSAAAAVDLDPDAVGSADAPTASAD
nr:hypothetical protein [Propionibacterium sp.]